MKTEVKYIGTVPVKLFTGEKPAKSVLAVHGFGGSKDSLAIEGLAQRLCDKGFRVAAPDPGDPLLPFGQFTLCRACVE